MARIFGLSGRITGRKGDAVFSVRKGEQIVRQYNPMVLNPNTEAQTVQRSKMKLSSQLSAVFANVIAIPSEGAKTTRNIFTKLNFPLIQRVEAGEEIRVEADLPKIQLTKSGRAMCPIAAGQAVLNGNVYVSLLQNCENEYDRVVYTVVAIQADGSMRVVLSHTVSDPGFDGRFAFDFAPLATNCLIYAYGIKYLSSKAYTTFDNTIYEEGAAVASLISGRQVSAADAQVTQTVGLILPVGVGYASSNEAPVMFVQNENDAHVANQNSFFVANGNVVNLDFEFDEGYELDEASIVIGAEPSIDIATDPYTWVVSFTGTKTIAVMEITAKAVA